MQKPKLLVATEKMPINGFENTVFFIFTHTKKGAIGVCVNRPTGDCEGTLFLGGPVKINSEVLMFHSIEDLESSGEIIKGLWTASPLESFEEISIRGCFDKCKIFNGYNCWGAGELEKEIEDSLWVIKTASPEIVLSRDVNIWNNLYFNGKRSYLPTFSFN